MIKSIALITGLLFSAHAASAVIDFDDAPGQDVLLPSNHYSGVTINNGVWVKLNSAWHDGAGGLGVDQGTFPTNNWAFPGVSSPIEVIFDTAVTEVSIDVFEVNFEGARVTVFDGLTQIAVEDFLPTGTQNHTFSFSAASITSIQLGQMVDSSGADGVAWDNLSFSGTAATVPGPSTPALLLLGLAFMRQRAARA